MTNEEFQRLILEKLGNLEEEVSEIKEEVLEIKEEVSGIKKDQVEIRKSLQATVDQTAELSEFRSEVNEKLDSLQQDIHAMEIITSKNWSDIAIMKAAR